MKLDKKIIKDLILEVIEENCNRPTMNNTINMVEEQDEKQALDFNNDAAVLKYLKDQYIEALSIASQEEDYSYESEDYDEDTGKVWNTIEFNEEKLVDAALEKFDELAYTGLGLEWIEDPQTPEDEEMNSKFSRIESFMNDNHDEITDNKEVYEFINSISKESASEYKDGMSYAKDPYAYYGVSRKDFM